MARIIWLLDYFHSLLTYFLQYGLILLSIEFYVHYWVIHDSLLYKSIAQKLNSKKMSYWLIGDKDFISLLTYTWFGPQPYSCVCLCEELNFKGPEAQVVWILYNAALTKNRKIKVPKHNNQQIQWGNLLFQYDNWEAI